MSLQSIARALPARVRSVLRWTAADRWRWTAVAVGVAAVGLIPVVVLPTNSDVAWLLYAAERVLNGARLYVDLVEVNPPLIVWLSLPPPAVAEALEVRSRIPFLVYVMGLVVLALRLCWTLLGHLGPGMSLRRKRAYLLLLVVALVTLPGWVYGQREHLMVILVAPYALAVAVRILGGSPSRAAAVAVGLLGGLGFALKPYYLPAWLGIEGLLVLERRRRDGGEAADLLPALWRSLRRPEPAAVVAVGLLYAAAVVLVTPEYFEMAERLAPVYVGVAETTVGALLTKSVTIMSLFGLGALAISRLEPPESVVARTFAVALAFWLLGAVLQLKGWWYHFYPALAAATVVVALVVAGRRSGGEPVLVRTVVPLVGVLVLAGALGGRVGEVATAIRTGADFDRRLPVTTELVREHVGPDGSLAVLSPHIYAAFPLVNRADVGWSLRFNSMWLLEAVYADAVDADAPVRYHAPEEMEPPERYLWESVLADLASDPPEVLLLDRQRLGAESFDYRDYFGRDERFRRLMASCEPLGRIGIYRAHRCRRGREQEEG